MHQDVDLNANIYSDISTEVIEFWGKGLPPEEYKELQSRYNEWIATGKYQEDDPAVQTLLRQICMAEYDVAQGRK